MREHRTSGSVEGARGDPRSYSDPRIAPAKPALEPVMHVWLSSHIAAEPRRSAAERCRASHIAERR
jgi:hypothetical protein